VGLSTVATVTPSTLAATAPAKATPTGGGAGRIAFVAHHDDKFQIYTIQPDGTGLFHLADMDTAPWQLQWSPDGTHLALRIIGGDIYVMKADGSNLIRLVHTEGAGFFSWSSDSKRIAYDSYVNAGSVFRNLQIYAVNVDGTGLIQITQGPDSHGHPAWSPDGRRIAFQFTKDPFIGNYEIHLINADGSGEVSIANGFANSQDVLWSPDATQLLIASGNPVQVYVMNADGARRKQLTNTSGNNLQAGWSPDGKWIVYASNVDGTSRIYVINADGSKPKKLTNDPDTADGFASWSPDGQWITFTSTRIRPNDNCCTSCCINVYLVKPDGTGQRRLTNEIEPTWQTTWQP